MICNVEGLQLSEARPPSTESTAGAVLCTQLKSVKAARRRRQPSASAAQERYVELLLEHKHLQEVNERLKRHEEVLLVTLAGLGDFLATLGKMLFELHGSEDSSSSEDFTTASIAALAQDLQAFQLLQLLGKEGGVAGAAAADLRTTRTMQQVVTQERVQQARAMLRHDPAAFELLLVQQLQQLTFRAGYMLKYSKRAVRYLAVSLDQISEQYIELVMLMMCVDQALMPRLTTMNLETMTVEDPAGDMHAYWESIAASMELEPLQVGQLTAAYKSYTLKRTAQEGQLRQLVQEFQQLLGTASDGSSNSSSEPWLQFRQAPAGCLSLETAQQLEALLQQVDKGVVQLRTLNHTMVFVWLNVLSAKQLAVSAVKAYPFLPRPIPLIHCIVRQADSCQA